MPEPDFQHVIVGSECQQFEGFFVYGRGLCRHDPRQESTKQAGWAAGLARNELRASHRFLLRRAVGLPVLPHGQPTPWSWWRAEIAHDGLQTTPVGETSAEHR